MSDKPTQHELLSCPEWTSEEIQKEYSKAYFKTNGVDRMNVWQHLADAINKRNTRTPNTLNQKQVVTTSPSSPEGSSASEGALNPGGVLKRWYCGKYPGVSVRRVNQRLLFVSVHSLPVPDQLVKEGHDYTPHPRRAAMPGELLLKDWVMGESMRTGMEPHHVYVRYYRGFYPNVEVSRRVNKRVVFVKVK